MKARALPGLSLACLACLACLAQPSDDERWLGAVERMVKKRDYKVSTFELHRVHILVDWALTNGYALSIRRGDTAAGENPAMLFTVLQLQKANRADDP